MHETVNHVHHIRLCAILPPGLNVTCRGATLLPTSSARYLGIIIDEHLSFAEQVTRVVTVVKQKVAAFRHGRRNLSLSARRLFYLSIIQPTLDYASLAYVHSLNQQNYDQLLRVSLYAIKEIFGLDRMTPSRIVLNHAQLYALGLRFNLKLYMFVYRCLHGLASPLLTSMFDLLTHSVHTNAITRAQTTASIRLPPARTRYGFSSLSFLAADRWNILPSDCRQARSPNEFIALTKQYLGFPVKRQ